MEPILDISSVQIHHYAITGRLGERLENIVIIAEK